MKHVKAMALATACMITMSPATAAANDYLTGYVGMFDFSQQDDEATQFGLEYRLSPIQYGFRPTVGANVSTDGSSYFYGGLNWDIGMLNDTLYLIPNFMVGAYSESDGKDLGGTLEFRSGIELAYQFPNNHRLGVAFNHISNASIYDDNPGAETLLINYSLPMGNLLGR